MIELRQVTFGYDAEPALRDVDLILGAQDYLAIIGPNGGGKTTLLKLMLGLLEPWKGQVVNRLHPGRMGYVPQFSTFDKTFPLRVAEVVVMGRLGRRGWLSRYNLTDHQAAFRAMDRLGLTELAQVPVGELSGGQLQRLLIARALACEPEVLFLDEPTASIDRESRERLSDVLNELNQRIPIVVVTHDVTAVASAVKQVACVNRSLYYHSQGELTAHALEEVYGCAVDLLAHGVPHRVLQIHTDH